MHTSQNSTINQTSRGKKHTHKKMLAFVPPNRTKVFFFFFLPVFPPGKTEGSVSDKSLR